MALRVDITIKVAEINREQWIAWSRKIDLGSSLQKYNLCVFKIGVNSKTIILNFSSQAGD